MTPRPSRSQLSPHTYFQICVRGNNGQKIFEDEQDRLRYLSLIEKYRRYRNLQCFAFCLMDNHAHMLFLTPSTQVLSKTMHAIQVAYAMYFNRKYERRGHLFQDRFSSWVVKDENHLLSTKEYIENNPVKAGMTTRREDYAWSSAFGDGSCVTLSQISG